MVYQDPHVHRHSAGKWMRVRAHSQWFIRLGQDLCPLRHQGRSIWRRDAWGCHHFFPIGDGRGDGEGIREPMGVEAHVQDCAEFNVSPLSDSLGEVFKHPLWRVKLAHYMSFKWTFWQRKCFEWIPCSGSDRKANSRFDLTIGNWNVESGKILWWRHTYGRLYVSSFYVYSLSYKLTRRLSLSIYVIIIAFTSFVET